VNRPYFRGSGAVALPRLQRALRKDTRWIGLPIIAMTARAMNGDKERCLEAGMNGYLSKPVRPSLLLSTVDEFLLQKTGLQTQMSALSAKK